MQTLAIRLKIPYSATLYIWKMLFTSDQVILYFPFRPLGNVAWQDRTLVDLEEKQKNRCYAYKITLEPNISINGLFWTNTTLCLLHSSRQKKCITSELYCKKFMPKASCYWYRDSGQKQPLAPVASRLPYLTDRYYKTMSCISSWEKGNTHKKRFLGEMMVISIDVYVSAVNLLLTGTQEIRQSTLMLSSKQTFFLSPVFL